MRVRPARTRAADGGSLVVISGARLGERIDIHDVPVVLGRSPEADFEIDHPSVSRFHCTVWQDGRRFCIRDLGSKNGTFVAGRKIVEFELHEGDLVTLGEIALKFVPTGGVEAKYHDEIHRLATIDSLTQLQNRRVFREAVDAAFAAAERHGEPLALAIVDVDKFKYVNDTYGHAAGDDALRSIATALRDMLRTGDVAGRLGGDE